MNAKIYAELEEAIDGWIQRNCDKTEWPEIILGDDTVAFMAQAARNVFDACQESQAYAKRNGLLAACAGADV